MPDSQQHYPVKLTQAQRKVVAEIAPDLADRLKLGDEADAPGITGLAVGTVDVKQGEAQ